MVLVWVVDFAAAEVLVDALLLTDAEIVEVLAFEPVSLGVRVLVVTLVLAACVSVCRSVVPLTPEEVIVVV